MTPFISYRQQLRQHTLQYRQASPEQSQESGFRLHPYQEEAVEKVWTAWREGHLSALVSLPTGTGKTEVALDLIRRTLEQNAQGRVLFLTHRRSLAMQTADRLEIRRPQWANDVGLVMEGVCETDRRIVVATIQSLVGQGKSRLALLHQIQQSGPFTLLVVDEAHHATARGYQDIARALRASVPGLLHLGLTATPVRHDRADLSRVYTLAYYRSVRWAIENGYLVPPEGIRVNTDVSLSSIRRRGGDFVDEALGQALNTPAFNDMLVRLYQEFLSGCRTLVFCATIRHAQAVRDEFEKHGITASLIVGTTPDDQRQNIVAAFVRGELDVMVNVGVFTEGVDIPCTEGLIVARPTQSAVLYTQMVGRALRLSPGKTKATIVDVTGTDQTLFTLDDMMESPSYRHAVRASVADHHRREATIVQDPEAASAHGPLRYWTEVVSLLGRSPTAWYSAHGRSVVSLARRQYALLMPPGGVVMMKAIQEQMKRVRSTLPDAAARLEWQKEHADDFCLYWIHDGTCDPVDWDHDYVTILSVASTWMEDKMDRSLAFRDRKWRSAPASERQVNSLARWGAIPSVEWLRAREREIGRPLTGGTASNLLSYQVALSVYAASGFVLPPVPEHGPESAESRFRRLLRGQKGVNE